jgi:hypothetical protein
MQEKSKEAKLAAKNRKKAERRMTETISWGEVNGRRPRVSSKDAKEKSLGHFLATARKSRKRGEGAGGNKFYDFWIEMTETHPMEHIKSYVRIRETTKVVVKEDSSKEEDVLLELDELERLHDELFPEAEISPEVEKEIIEELSEVNQSSNAKGMLFQPVFKGMEDLLKEEPEVIEEELVSSNEDPIDSAEREYLRLNSDLSNEALLELANKILKGQNEEGIQESIEVVKEICDFTILHLVDRIQHLYFT